MDFAHLLTDTYAIVLLAVGAAAFVYLALSYGLTFLRMGIVKEADSKTDTASGGGLPSVSVVLVAQNNADMLRQHIPGLLEQDYPNYEVVVVDYESKDDTEFVLQLCEENFPNLKRVKISENVNFFHGKKYPLAIGIKSAKNDIIVLTDVDCEPESENWLRSVVKGYKSAATKIVLAPTRLDAKPGLLGILERYDNMVYHCQFMSAATLGHVYTGLGSNLSYRRSFFFENDGFIRHYLEPYGDDDIFVNRNGRKGNTEVVLSPDSMMKKDAPGTFALWSYMRRQRVMTRCYYSFIQRIRIVMRPLALALFYAACVLMFLEPMVPWVLPVALLVLKLLWQEVCVWYGQRRFLLKNFHWASPLFELYFMVADTILAIITLHRKRCNP